MAQKKGLIYRLTMGKDNLPDFTPDKLPGTRFGQFKDVFFGRLGAMVKINLLVILFAIPLIAVIVIFYLMKRVDAGIVPYSGNIGIGYPVVPDAAAIGDAHTFMYNTQMFLFMIPCIMILSIGLSGAFYVMRRFVWGEGVGVAAHFFHGIKANIVPFLWSSLFVAVSLFLVLFNITSYGQLNIPTALKIIGLAVSIIQFILVISMAIFLTTQAVTYKLKTWGLIKNSFLFAIALIPTNIFILIFSVLPVLLLILCLNISILNIILIMIFLLLGISFIICIWTIYGHWAFDKFINDKVEGAVKNRGMYKVTEEEKRLKEEKNLVSKNIRFNNPANLNKKLGSIDDGSTFEPLSPTFSRADLEKLAVEKEIVKKEIDAEYAHLEPAEKTQKPKTPVKKEVNKTYKHVNTVSNQQNKSKIKINNTKKKK